LPADLNLIRQWQSLGEIIQGYSDARMLAAKFFFVELQRAPVEGFGFRRSSTASPSSITATIKPSIMARLLTRRATEARPRRRPRLLPIISSPPWLSTMSNTQALFLARSQERLAPDIIDRRRHVSRILRIRFRPDLRTSSPHEVVETLYHGIRSFN
jgi:hypothetical protein